jgi:hypothetical protein
LTYFLFILSEKHLLKVNWVSQVTYK